MTVFDDDEPLHPSSQVEIPKGPAANEATKQPKAQTYGEVRALLDELIAAFPACFKPHATPDQSPLKIGVGDDILARKPALDPALLSKALSVYASGPAYYRSLIAGRPRVDLDGNVAQAITAEEIAIAEKRLAAFELKEKARHKSYEEVSVLLDELIVAFPHCFKPRGTPGQPPLKIGIHADILARKPEINPALLHAAIRTYVLSPAYQHSVIARQPRVDLDGNVAQGVITDEEAAHAKIRLESFRQKFGERRKTQSLEAKPPGDQSGHKPPPRVEPPKQAEPAAARAHPVAIRQRKATPPSA